MRKGRYPEQLQQRHDPRFRRVPIVGNRAPMVQLTMPMYKYPNPKTVVLMDLTRQHLGRHYPGIRLAVYTPTSTSVAFARSKATEMFFREKECSHVLMVDDDMRWPLGGDDEKDPFNPIARLLSLDKDVVGGLGFTRHQPLRPFIGEAMPNGWGRVMNEIKDENLMRAGKPFQVGYIGFGMVMISRRCLERVAEMVGVRFDEEGNVTEGTVDSLFTSETNWAEREGALDELRAFLAKPIGSLLQIGAMEKAKEQRLRELVELVDKLIWKAKAFGEDWSFCKKARRAGCEVWVDPAFELGHYGDYSYSLKDFLGQQELARLEAAQEEKPESAIQVVGG